MSYSMRPAGKIAALLFTVALVAVGCGRSPQLIPRDFFFQPTLRSNVMISPNGEYLAWYEKADLGPRLLIKAIESGDTVAVVGMGTAGGYNFWSRDSGLLIYVMSDDTQRGLMAYELETGNEWPVLMQSTDPETREVKHDIALEIIESNAKDPAWIAVRMNARIPSVVDLYRLNLYTGEMVELARGSEDLLRWYVDHELNLRAKLLSEPDGGQTLYRYNPNSNSYSKEITWTINDDASWPLSFNLAGDIFYMFDSRGRDTRALVAYDMESRESTLLAVDKQYDISYILFDHQGCRPLAAVVNGERLVYIPTDPIIEEGLSVLSDELKGDFRIVSRSYNNNRWAVMQVRDDAPPSYYLFDRMEQSITKLFDARAPIKGKLASMEPIEFPARDGMMLHGYLTKPVAGRAPWPTVVVAHGGPWRRHLWGFDPEAQWLANRGYAVLMVNFRGSEGYGKVYLNAGNREWGEAMNTDLADGVAWLVKHKIAREEKVAIGGSNYGGYAALAGACFTPGIYNSVVAINPYLDLADYLGKIPPTWEAYRTNLENRIGVVPRYESGLNKGEVKDSVDWTETDRANMEDLISRSPYYHVKRIDVPLLLGVGEHDPMADKRIADKFVKKLKLQGNTVEYVVYEKSGRSLRQKDVLDFYARVEVFLAAYLGGSLQPPEMEREVEVSVKTP